MCRKILRPASGRYISYALGRCSHRIPGQRDLVRVVCQAYAGEVHGGVGGVRPAHGVGTMTTSFPLPKVPSPPLATRLNVCVVTVVGSIGSLNVATMVEGAL